MQSPLKPGQRVYLQVDNQGRIVSNNLHIGRFPPRGPNGYWVEITDCVNSCCSTTTTSTTTSGE